LAAFELSPAMVCFALVALFAFGAADFAAGFALRARGFAGGFGLSAGVGSACALASGVASGDVARLEARLSLRRWGRLRGRPPSTSEWRSSLIVAT
jgi:hypothetical protein